MKKVIAGIFTLALAATGMQSVQAGAATTPAVQPLAVKVYKPVMVSDSLDVHVTYDNPDEYSNVVKSKLTGSATHTIQYDRKKNTAKKTTEFYLTIDGKRVWKSDTTKAEGVEVSVLRVSKNERLINIVTSFVNDYILSDKLYRYEGEKLKLVANLLKAMPKQSDYRQFVGTTVETKSDGTIAKHLTLEDTAMGLFHVRATFKLSGSKVTFGKKAMNMSLWTGGDGVHVKTHHATAYRKLQTYTTAGGTKKAFTVAKGQSITIGNMKVVNGKVYFLISIVKNSKEYRGWIKAVDKKLIKEASYAA
ncbi:MAG: hypothetical protein LBR21_03360 [Propionibacteriaceae bacterium]|jgi:hypothetical protein|nr:hypothetical protein [Propionibacteriaceae bacterium]